VLGNNRHLRGVYFSLEKAFHKSTDFSIESFKIEANPLFRDLSFKFAESIPKK